MLHVSWWKTVLIWFAVLLSVLFAVPNLLNEQRLASFPNWFAQRKVELGLDLKGGSHIMLKIERDDVVRNRLETVVGDISARLRTVNIPYSGLTGTGQKIQLRINDPAQVQAAVNALKPITDAASGKPEATLSQGDNGALSIDITDAGIKDGLSAAVTRSLKVISNRIVQLDVGEPLIRRQGADRIVIQVPGLGDPQRLKNLLNQPAELSFRLVDSSMPVQDAMNGRPPAGSEVLFSEDDPPAGYLLQKQPLLSNIDFADAAAVSNTQNNDGNVTVKLTPEATGRFAQATAANLGKVIAVVLDGQVLSSASLKNAITTGEINIPGDFTAQGAQDLSVMLKSGPLPATLTTVEERTIEPGLGNETMRSGVMACVIAAIFVAALMIGFYGLLGVAATIALIINIVMVLALMGVFGITLTLPGIAAIVLIIGMALDANVLIYERVREEEKKTHLLVDALRHGFNRAVSTVADANFTVLIIAAILFYVSSGAVRGFAATLIVGVFTTFFTACFVTRSLVSAWISHRKPRVLLAGVRSGIFDGANIRFMGIRRYTFTVSAALSVATLLAFAAVGMHLGIDFTGGSIIEVRAKQGVADTADIQARLQETIPGDVQVEGLDDRLGAVIRVHAQEGGENAEQSALTLVRDELSKDYDFSRVEVVGPSVSGEITKTASLAVLAALAAILIYIWVRFEWQFAVGAIIATLHDVILTLGLFVLTGMEFNMTGIAALLTIVGYSLNDTVVVYDRMRENLRRYSQMPLPILIDASINQTLSRTVLTSATTLLALLALYIFGGEVIRSFTFVLLFGVAVGTFSSIYIAAPVLIVFKLRPDKFQAGGESKGHAGSDMQSEKPAV
ncbi:protein translocase subunit SecDF [Rhizobium rhizogenes]|uniref:protein translocase subunit SecDF n=1 Tax=Rhizobium rhizogenes TaxID=359 RepID=UPI001574EA77|nr:protein translocase subunit SecDF [Rhizobium rhizogenes]NTG73472.1 protein translocase subunit SecDF [Rhizobium rhizogenes]QRM37392.1 protein translocase subunit SecDF [Rhizobium rhizogenes]